MGISRAAGKFDCHNAATIPNFGKTKHLRKSLFILFLLAGVCAIGQSQDIYQKYDIYRSPIRVFLNRFSWTLTTGYGKTYYKHDLQGYYFLQDADGQYILPNDPELTGNAYQGYVDWFNDPGQLITPLDVTDPSVQFFANSDTAAIGFRGISHGIPITAQLHYNFLEKFRVGIGYSWEKQYINALEPTTYRDIIRPYQPNIKSTRYSRLFATAGYQFYEYYDHLFVAELQFGRIRSGPNEFNRAAVTQTTFLNFGVSMEKELSEYLRIILKPSVDIKNYKVSIPGGTDIRHGHPTLFLQVGVSINIPEIPRSPISNDHVQVKHVITDPKSGRLIEVRGQPITKWQNPKVGQNHRKLWRYKNKNKKKVHPY